ncbi:hypothetical protein HK102_011816, partial [Quaeritorhiza haematococci]
MGGMVTAVAEGQSASADQSPGSSAESGPSSAVSAPTTTGSTNETTSASNPTSASSSDATAPSSLPTPTASNADTPAVPPLLPTTTQDHPEVKPGRKRRYERSAAGSSSSASSVAKGGVDVPPRKMMRPRRAAAARNMINYGGLFDERDPYTMVQASPFLGPPGTGNPSQPFAIEVSPSVMAFMDLHAHLMQTEVIGFLAGEWDREEKKLRVVSAFPCRGLEDGHIGGGQQSNDKLTIEGGIQKASDGDSATTPGEDGGVESPKASTGNSKTTSESTPKPTSSAQPSTTPPRAASTTTITSSSGT